jgi:iron complex outermembrane recepter protein
MLRTRHNILITSALSGLATVTCMASSVAAQDVVQAAVSPVVETIIVTANKTNARLERVPAALSVIQGRDVVARGITNFEGLVDEVPCVSINYAFGGASSGLLSIRGVGGADDYKPNGSPSVAMHVDGIYQSSNAYLTTPFYDIERIEVLKGPQGTLYGRNTTAGVINVLTRAPTQDFQASVNVRAGSYESLVGEGIISGPLLANVSGRLALYREQGGGFMDGLGAGSIAGFRPSIAGVVQTQVPAVTDPGPRKGFGDKDITSGRATLLIDFSDTSTLTLRAFATADRSEVQPYDRIERALDPTIFNPGENADPFKFYSNAYYGRKVDVAGAMGQFDHRLGELSLAVVAGYQSLDRNVSGNGDGTPYPQFQYEFIEALTQSSLEARLYDAQGGAVDWLVGAFVMIDDAKFDSIWTSLSVRSVYRSDHVQKRNSAAIFGQATWNVTDRFNATLGLRHTWDDANYVGVNTDLNPWGISTFRTSFATTSPFSWDRDFDDNRTTAKLTLQYEVNDYARIFASYGNGYRAGGFDGTSIFTLEETFPFASETVEAFEAGFRWTGSGLRVSIDVFNNRYKELQATTRLANDTNGRTNVGAAVTSGADISVQARLFDDGKNRLDLSTSLSGLNSEITAFSSARIADVIATLGDPLPGAPRLNSNLSLTHIWKASANVVLTSRLSYSYHGEESNRLNAVPGNTAPAYELINARTELMLGERYSFYIFGRNLGDTVYFPELNGPVRLVGAPRAFGAGFSVQW